MTHEIRSIDALINSIPEAQPINPGNSPAVKEAPQEVPVKVETPAEPDAYSEPEVEVAPETEEKTDYKTSDTASEDKDEYGNDVPKKKMYTEEEVQRMIRDRLKRGAFKNAEQQPQQQPVQPTQQQVQQAQDSGFQYNEDSEKTWSQQLEEFVEQTLYKVNAKHQQKAMEAQNKAKQAEFESKFYSEMDKYPDFVEVLSDKPVTNEMMIGIRGLDNPAAFLYAAAKRQPAELERIAKIADPYQQIAEMGRLHERMVKNKNSSNAPRPVTRDRSDISDSASPAKVSIDHLIAQDAFGRVRR